MHADLLIIGSGVAGTYAALTALKAGARVVLATKGTLSSGSTRWAQGGIAFPQGPDDLPGHLEDTLTAGRGLSEPQVVQGLLEEALLHKERLLELGVPFDPPPRARAGTAAPASCTPGGTPRGTLCSPPSSSTSTGRGSRSWSTTPLSPSCRTARASWGRSSGRRAAAGKPSGPERSSSRPAGSGGSTR